MLGNEAVVTNRAVKHCATLTIVDHVSHLLRRRLQGRLVETGAKLVAAR